jgi:hypothetical protein
LRDCEITNSFESTDTGEAITGCEK